MIMGMKCFEVNVILRTLMQSNYLGSVIQLAVLRNDSDPTYLDGANRAAIQFLSFLFRASDQFKKLHSELSSSQCS